MSKRVVQPTKFFRPDTSGRSAKPAATGTTVDLTTDDDNKKADTDSSSDDDDDEQEPIPAHHPKFTDGSNKFLPPHCQFGGPFRYHPNMTLKRPVPAYADITPEHELEYAVSKLFTASADDIAFTEDRPDIEGHGVVILKDLPEAEWISDATFSNGPHRLPHEIKDTLRVCGRFHYTDDDTYGYFAKDAEGYFVLIRLWESYDTCLKLVTELRNAWLNANEKRLSPSSSTAQVTRPRLGISDSRLRRAIQTVCVHRDNMRKHFVFTRGEARTCSLVHRGRTLAPDIDSSRVVNFDQFYNSAVKTMISVLEACQHPATYKPVRRKTYLFDMDDDTDVEDELLNPYDFTRPDVSKTRLYYFAVRKDTGIPHASLNDDTSHRDPFPQTRPDHFDPSVPGLPLDANNSPLHYRRIDFRGPADLRPYVIAKTVGPNNNVRFSYLSFLEAYSGRLVMPHEVRLFSAHDYDRDDADCILYNDPVTVPDVRRNKGTTNNHRLLVLVMLDDPQRHSDCRMPHQLYATMTRYIDDEEHADVNKGTKNPDYNEKFLAAADSLEFEDADDLPETDNVTAADVAPHPPKDPKSKEAAPKRRVSSGGNGSAAKSTIAKPVDLALLLLAAPHDADPSSEVRRMLDAKLTNDGDRQLYLYVQEVMASHHIGARDQELPQEPRSSTNTNYRCHVQGPYCTGNGRQVCMHCSLRHHSLAYTICANCQPLHVVNMAFDAVLALRHCKLTRSHFEHVTRLAARTYFAGKPELIDHITAICDVSPSDDSSSTAVASSSATRPSAEFLQLFENFSHRITVPPTDSAEFLTRRVRLLTAMTARAQEQLDSLTPKTQPTKKRPRALREETNEDNDDDEPHTQPEPKKPKHGPKNTKR